MTARSQLLLLMLMPLPGQLQLRLLLLLLPLMPASAQPPRIPSATCGKRESATARRLHRVPHHQLPQNQ